MAKKTSKLTASSKAIDPTLDALFASSSGPVQAPPKSRYSAFLETKSRNPSKPVSTSSSGDDEEAEKDDEELSEISEEIDYEEEEEENDDDNGRAEDVNASTSNNEGEQDEKGKTDEQNSRRERKRKRKDDNDDLEAKHLAELTKNDPNERSGKRPKSDAKDKDDKGEEGGQDSKDAVPTHESLSKGSKGKDPDIEKANRTVFLANISIDTISSKAAKKALINHLSSVLEPQETPAQKFESIRFRSVAFSTGSMPKRAAYITKSLMEATTKSANAYAVFSTPAAARLVASKLNGTEVLGRHIRVDSVAHPSPTDHRRCVFVGNLGFVDDETIVNTNEDGEKVEKKRIKVPADAEEGLWRIFGKAGKVENVRVVRDSKTRVGKGFAYVQFYDANDVEAALLLNGKKFPPLLPRILRVNRAMDPRKTALAQEKSKAKLQAADRQARSTKYIPKMTPEQQAAAGRAKRLLGHARGFIHRQNISSGGDAVSSASDPSQKMVFEGNRASVNDGRPKGLKFGKGKKSKGRPKPKNRSARRAAEWKKR